MKFRRFHFHAALSLSHCTTPHQNYRGSISLIVMVVSLGEKSCWLTPQSTVWWILIISCRWDISSNFSITAHFYSSWNVCACNWFLIDGVAAVAVNDSTRCWKEQFLLAWKIEFYDIENDGKWDGGGGMFWISSLLMCSRLWHGRSAENRVYSGFNYMHELSSWMRNSFGALNWSRWEIAMFDIITHIVNLSILYQNQVVKMRKRRR